MANASVKSLFQRLGDALTDVRGTLLCCSVVLFLDVVLSGSYMFAALVLPICFLANVVRTIAWRTSWGVAAARVLIPVATLLLVLANNSLQVSIAQDNSARLIQAYERYHEANGIYPDRLGDLVPLYLGSIPRAKYCMLWGDFQYFSSPPDHLLAWTELPPFGQWVYGFDGTRDWNYLD